jgi:hypothetical protein
MAFVVTAQVSDRSRQQPVTRRAAEGSTVQSTEVTGKALAAPGVVNHEQTPAPN